MGEWVALQLRAERSAHCRALTRYSAPGAGQRLGLLVAFRLRAECLTLSKCFSRQRPRAHARRGCAPARRLTFGTRQKDAKTCQRAFPPLSSTPRGGRPTAGGKSGRLVCQTKCSFRAEDAPSMAQAPTWIAGRRCRRAFQSLRASSKECTRSNQAPVPPLAGYPRVMPASSQPFPARPRSSAPPRAQTRCSVCAPGFEHRTTQALFRPRVKNQAVRYLRAFLISPEGTPQGQWFAGAKRALSLFRDATSEPLPRGLASLR